MQQRRGAFRSTANLEEPSCVNDSIQINRKLTHSGSLLQRHEYTLRDQLSMFRIAKYTSALWCFRVHLTVMKEL